MGCDRSPDDLEQWRTAQGGYEKLAGWVASAEEPMLVRERGVQILVEEGQAQMLQPVFETKLADEATRAQLANAAVPSVETLWKSSELPQMPAEASAEEKEAGAMKIDVASFTKPVQAKDAAYFLQPYATGEQKARLETILRQWLSTDWELRTRVDEEMSKTTMAQLIPRAGQGAVSALIPWIEQAKQPDVVAAQIREYGDQEVEKKLGEALVAVAEKQHPDVKPAVATALLQAEHDVVVPYLEKVILDPKASGAYKDQAMDVIVRLRKERATPFLTKVIQETTGKERWTWAWRIIELRGKEGVRTGISALPLDVEAYAQGDALAEEARKYCNFVGSELKEQGQGGEVQGLVEWMLSSNRWPAQTLGLECARVHKLTNLKPKVEALVGVRAALPSYGEVQSVGQLAEQVAAAL